MTDTQISRPRPAGETSSSPRRPPQRLVLPTLSFDLLREQELLRQEESYRSGDRNAKTLVKEHGLSVVLTVMRSGARLQEHKTASPLSPGLVPTARPGWCTTAPGHASPRHSSSMTKRS